MSPFLKFPVFALALAAFCVFVGNAPAQTPPTNILARGSSWKYHNLNQNLFSTQPTWNQPGYSDSSWAGPGPAPIGYNLQNSIQYCATAIDIGATLRYPVVFYRHSFTLPNSGAAYQALILRVQADDSAAIYLNGSLLLNDAVPTPGTFTFGGRGADLPDEILYREYTVSATGLVAGVNVLAVENHNQTDASSDLQFDLEIEGLVDNVAPTASYDPAPGAVVLGLNSINVVFSELVTGLNASDLLINGQPATNVMTINPNDFTFSFPTPDTGVVDVAWASSHGITDTAPAANPFAGGSWTYTYDPNATVRPNVIITEFMAQNDNGIRDEDGDRRDWIELYNLGPLSANLEGFFLTDDRTNLTRWRFPSIIVPASQYLIVWASGKNRTGSTPLHTDFRLDASGGYLALVDPDTNVVSEFDPYLTQSPDVSYGRAAGDPTEVGYFSAPTPGTQNSTRGTGFVREPIFSLANGVYTNTSLSLTITSPDGGQIRYTRDGTIPTATSLLYSVPITIDVNSTVKARVFLSGSGLLPSPVVARTFVMLDDTTRNFSSNIPILILSTEGRSIPAGLPPGSTNRTRGSLAVFDTFRGRASLQGDPEFQGLAAYEIFGQTSSGFTKRPHRIEIQDALGNDRSIGLLGMPADADWRLRNPFSDKCLMNDFMAFEMFEDMGNYSVRRRLVEIFVDTGGGKLTYPADYHGVLLLTENIEVNKDRVDLTKLTPAHTNEPAISGGWMIKYDKDSAGDIEIQTIGGGGFQRLGQATQVGRGLKIHEPKPNELGVVATPTTTFANLSESGKVQVRWLTNWLAQMERSLYAANWRTATGTNHWSHYIDADSFVDHHWIVEFPKQIDGYRLSNYMQKDRNGKLKMAPIWDWNLSFGNADYLEGGLTNGWYYEDTSELDHPWLRRLIAGTTASTGTAGDPDFNQKIADRWSVMRTHVMNGQRVLTRIDEVANMLSEAAVRDFARFPRLYPAVYDTGRGPGSVWPNPNGPPNWHVDYVRPTNYAGIITEMKKWTLGRHNWIDSNFTPPPIFSASDGMVSSGSTLTITAPPGVSPTNIFYTLNGTDPRTSYDPATGSGVAGTTNGTRYTGPITITGNARVVARARQAGKWQNTWSGPAAVSLYTILPALRITEIMYHPADPQQPSSFTDEDFEYVELRNTGTDLLNLNGYRIRGGIDFVFPNITLTAGQRVLVVKNREAFSALYDTNGMIIAGEFSSPLGATNNLDNTGERLVLEGRFREPIHDFRYDDDWHKITDGLGFSLTIIDDSLPPSSWTNAANWRRSYAVHGTPGAADPAPPGLPGGVVINEALTHTDLPVVDAIELYNPTGSPKDISHWYLSDDRLDAKKFRIPNGITIAAGGFMSFNESQFNAGPRPFSLSSQGDEVFLSSGDAAGELTGYSYGFSFDGQRNGITFGRHINSVGETHFVAQSANTLNAPNSAPLVGDLVISEINYHPTSVLANGAYWNNSEDEFVELHNRGGSPITLNYPGHANFTWRLDNAVEFDFAPGTTIPAGGYLVVVNFNPVTKPQMLAAFRSKFNVPPAAQIVGPYQGDLSNDDETVALYQPDTPFTNQNFVVEAPSVLVEEVRYDDEAPWPAAAPDGAGFSLHRRTVAQYANDPANWDGGAPTPGRGFTAGSAPAINTQPQPALVVAGSSVSPISVGAGGIGPFTYQWRKEGQVLGGQRGSSLTFASVRMEDAGNYDVIVMNNSGFVLSSSAYLTVVRGITINQHPASQNIRAGQPVTFSVNASSDNPISYQWRFNGSPLSGANSSNYTIANVQATHGGVYDVAMTDVVGTVVSAPATLLVLINPTVVVHPLAQTVPAGSDVTVTVQVTNTATLPIGYRWRRNGSTAFSNNVHSYFNFFTLTNIQGSNVVDVICYNLAATSGLQSQRVGVVGIADSDGDGMPDDWEARYNLNPNSSADASQDLDGDTMSNLKEYIAGTDPTDPDSFLKINIPEGGGPALVSFEAVSNRSYTVQFSDAPNNPSWTGLDNFSARGTNWSATAIDPASPPTRYYRLVTPIQQP